MRVRIIDKQKFSRFIVGIAISLGVMLAPHKIYTTDNTVMNTVEAEPSVIPVVVSTPIQVVTPQPVSKYIYYDVPLSNEFQEYLQDLCNEYEIKYEILLGIIEKESRFNPKVVGSRNTNGTIDYGLCQINSAYLGEFAKLSGYKNFDVFNPYHNAKAAIVHMGNLKKQLQDKGMYSYKMLIITYGYGFQGGLNYAKSHNINNEHNVIKTYENMSKLKRKEVKK